MALATKSRPIDPPDLSDVFEGERQLVGLLLADPTIYRTVAEILRGEDFTERLHRGVFEVAGELAAAGRPIALASILPRVSDVGPDGSPAGTYLAALMTAAPGARRAEAIARRLAAAARARHRPDIYGLDLYAWAFAQAQHLRRGAFSSLDALNLAEEIEDLGNEIYNRLESALRITLMHLLKWDHQPARRTRSWTLSIRAGRRTVEKTLDRHPGVKGRLSQALTEAYGDARLEAVAETGLDEDTFPAACPYDFDTIMNRPIPWPPSEQDA
ncbi:DUF29 family protein [Methylobacterium sp. A54F]